MISSPVRTGYSAEVQMSLHLPSQTVGIAQMGPDFFILDEPMRHAPCQAFVTLKVDDDLRRWEVALPQGIAPEMRRVPIGLLEASPL
jgi:hypothetical protein